jgi:DNA polymerase
VTNDYTRVLESTEQHLLALKAGGVRFLNIEKETLRQLRQVPVRRAAPAIPKAVAVTAAPAVETAPVQAQVQEIVTDKASAMAALNARAAVCVKCPNLASSRKNVVFGVGDINASLMFVGEAPGADEDAQGEPFVGAAGQLLTRIIKAMGFDRQHVYIANILKCRPDTPGKTSGNRKPTSEEMNTCLPYLLEQINIIRPKVIVALGATAIEGLLGKTDGIGKLRGRFQTFRDVPLMPTFHPAYLLRNQAVSEKRKVWEDMLQVMEKLESPISEKQRGFFLKA